MSNHSINPEKVTKPIQLLAAWFVALILVNGSFLMAAQNISNPIWASGVLIWASVLNVPLFITSLFILQTKFRAQLQEDSYYSEYLHKEREYSNSKIKNKPNKVIDMKEELEKTASQIISALKTSKDHQKEVVVDLLKKSHLEELSNKFGESRSLSELFKSPETWKNLVKRWNDDRFFESDISPLIDEGLIVEKGKGYASCKLSELGEKVAIYTEEKGRLWSQTHKSHWEDERVSLKENS